MLDLQTAVELAVVFYKYFSKALIILILALFFSLPQTSQNQKEGKNAWSPPSKPVIPNPSQTFWILFMNAAYFYCLDVVVCFCFKSDKKHNVSPK